MGALDWLLLGIVALCALAAFRVWRKSGGCSCGSGCDGNCAHCAAHCDEPTRQKRK